MFIELPEVVGRAGGVIGERIVFHVEISLAGEKGSDGSMNPDDGLHQHEL